MSTLIATGQDAGALEALQGEYGARYWIRCSGRMWIATARVDDDTEPTLICDSAAELAAAMSNPGPRIGRWQPLNPNQ